MVKKKEDNFRFDFEEYEKRKELEKDELDRIYFSGILDELCKKKPGECEEVKANKYIAPLD